MEGGEEIAHTSLPKRAKADNRALVSEVDAAWDCQYYVSLDEDECIDFAMWYVSLAVASTVVKVTDLLLPIPISASRLVGSDWLA